MKISTAKVLILICYLKFSVHFPANINQDVRLSILGTIYGK